MKYLFSMRSTTVALFTLLALLLTACETTDADATGNGVAELRFDTSLTAAGIASKAADPLTIEEGGAITLVVGQKTYAYTINSARNLVPAASSEPILVPMAAAKITIAAYGTLNASDDDDDITLPVRVAATELSVSWTNDEPTTAIAFAPASTLLTLRLNGLFSDENLSGFQIASPTLFNTSLTNGLYPFDTSGTLLSDVALAATTPSTVEILPAEIPSGAPIFTITAPEENSIYTGKTYTVYNTSDEPITFSAAHHYTITLTLTGTLEVKFTVTDGDNTWTFVEEKKTPTKEGYKYFISTANELAAFRKAVNEGETDATAIQTKDIILSGTWTPIGTSSNPFIGKYNGNGYIISNLSIPSSTTYSGLFGFVGEGALLTGIHLKGVNITNDWNFTGALAGYILGSDTAPVIISLCSASGTVKGAAQVGGLIGLAKYAHITRCHAAVDVTGVSAKVYAGGLVGTSSDIKIIASSATGSVDATATSSDAYAGGLVGDYGGNDCDISLCYATGAVSGTAAVNLRLGGLVGAHFFGKIFASYATGIVTNTGTTGDNKYIGTLVGLKAIAATITYCNAPTDTGAGQKFIGTQSGILPDNNTITATDRPATIGAPGTSNIRTSDPIKTTLWTSSGYSLEVADWYFYSDKVWTNADAPLINYDYNGEKAR